MAARRRRGQTRQSRQMRHASALQPVERAVDLSRSTAGPTWSWRQDARPPASDSVHPTLMARLSQISLAGGRRAHPRSRPPRVPSSARASRRRPGSPPAPRRSSAGGRSLAPCATSTIRGRGPHFTDDRLRGPNSGRACGEHVADRRFDGGVQPGLALDHLVDEPDPMRTDRVEPAAAREQRPRVAPRSSR